MTNKTGWVTELDVIVGADTLTDAQKTYRQSQKVYINPKYESVRGANRKAGITYIVSAGYEYKFDCAQDVWSFPMVKDRAYCGYDYFIGELNAGRVWSSGDVEVRISNKNKPVYCVELTGLKWTYETALEAWTNNKALQVRKSYSKLPIEGVITGIRNYEDFVTKLDEGYTLGFHALRVYKTTESEV